jgi:acid phosphatase
MAPRVPRARLWLPGAAILLAAIAVAVGLSLRHTSPKTPQAVGSPVPRLGHVVVVVLENKDQPALNSAPQFQALARRGAILSAYSGITHPSLPNYLALVSGSTHGVTTDCTTCTVSGPSLAATLGAGGWKAYAEGLPSPGWTGATSGEYAKRHMPFLYFRDVLADPSLRNRVVPLTSLQADLRTGRLPRFSLIVPNVCHDMHDCSVATGDRWLGRFMKPLLSSPALGNGAVFVVFDEDEGNDNNKVPGLAVGPAVKPGTAFAGPTNHYGLLRTVEEALRLPQIGESRQATAITGIWRR